MFNILNQHTHKLKFDQQLLQEESFKQQIMTTQQFKAINKQRRGEGEETQQSMPL
jgi:hypothetical protein